MYLYINEAITFTEGCNKTWINGETNYVPEWEDLIVKIPIFLKLVDASLSQW